jgi:hypothetical protein
MAQLRDQGLITRDSGAIGLLDLDALGTLSQGEEFGDFAGRN